MKKVFVLVLLVAGLALVGCTFGKLPAAPASTTPLVEYSDDGETWKPLVKSDVVYLSAPTVKVRKTEKGAAFIITLTGDLGALNFKGSITKEEETLVVEGSGVIIVKFDADPYAKLVLE